MKKYVFILLIALLVGCSSADNSKVKALEKEVLDLQEKLERKESGEPDPIVLTSFKDKVVVEMLVLGKLQGDMLFPVQVIATPLDRDHNTPQLLVTTVDIYEQLEVGKEYKLELYYIFVVEPDHTRVESSILNILK